MQFNVQVHLTDPSVHATKTVSESPAAGSGFLPQCRLWNALCAVHAVGTMSILGLLTSKDEHLISPFLFAERTARYKKINQRPTDVVVRRRGRPTVISPKTREWRRMPPRWSPGAETEGFSAVRGVSLCLRGGRQVSVLSGPDLLLPELFAQVRGDDPSIDAGDNRLWCRRRASEAGANGGRPDSTRRRVGAARRWKSSVDDVRAEKRVFRRARRSHRRGQLSSRYEREGGLARAPEPARCHGRVHGVPSRIRLPSQPPEFVASLASIKDETEAWTQQHQERIRRHEQFTASSLVRGLYRADASIDLHHPLGSLERQTFELPKLLGKPARAAKLPPILHEVHARIEARAQAYLEDRKARYRSTE